MLTGRLVGSMVLTHARHRQGRWHSHSQLADRQVGRNSVACVCVQPIGYGYSARLPIALLAFIGSHAWREHAGDRCAHNAPHAFCGTPPSRMVHLRGAETGAEQGQASMDDGPAIAQ